MGPGPLGPHLGYPTSGSFFGGIFDPEGDKERPEVTQGVTRLLLENLMSKPFSFIRLQAGICDPMKEKDVFRHLGVLQGISQEIPQAGAEAGATRCMEGDP